MSRALLVLCLAAALLGVGECGLKPSAKETGASSLYTSNNVPKVDKGCTVHFECKKKLKEAEVPKPCVKFCVKYIECENGEKVRGRPGQCAELNEQLVAQEYNECKRDEDDTVNIMQVALIDFPCQPGYLPDSRGRCREVW